MVDDDLVINEWSTADLPPARGRRDKNKDAERILDCLERKELRRPNATLDKMSPNDYEHIRTHVGVEIAFKEFSRLSKLVPILVISLDIEETEDRATKEKHPTLLQLSARVGNDKYTVVFQLWSKSKDLAIPHIFHETPNPPFLRRIFEIDNAAFHGKNVAHDARKAAKLAGMKEWDIDTLLIIDTQHVFNFVDAYARGPDVLREWMENGGRGYGRLGNDISLKHFCQFVDETRILSKKPSHRNHLANFGEMNGPISARDLGYAANDVDRPVAMHLRLLEMLGLPPGCFPTRYAEPNVFENCTFVSAVETYCKIANLPPLVAKPLIDALPPTAIEMVKSLRENAPAIRRKMANFQVTVLEERFDKEVLTCMNKAEREDRPEPSYVIEKQPPPPTRILGLPITAMTTTTTTTTTAAREPIPEAITSSEEQAESSSSSGESDVVEFKRRRREMIRNNDVYESMELVVDPSDKPSGQLRTVIFPEFSSSPNIPASMKSPLPVPHPSSSSPFTPFISNNLGPKNQKSASLLKFTSKVTFSNPPASSESENPTPVSAPTEKTPKITPLLSISFPNRSFAKKPTPHSVTTPAVAPVQPPPPPPPPVPAPPQIRCTSAMTAGQKRKAVDDFDDRLIARIVERLKVARTTDFGEVLVDLLSPSETIMVERFVRTLALLRKNDTRNQRTFVAARAMLPHIPEETRNFLRRLCVERVFGDDRLNVAVQLHLSCISPLVLLNDLFAKNHNSENLKKAVQSFSPTANAMVLTTLAENVDDPKALLAKLREAPCFRNFDVVVAETRFSPETAADFIKTVATTKGFEPPMVAKKLYLRVRLDVELKKYFNGETEILDFYQLCVVLTGDDETLFQHCATHVAGNSNILGKFIAESRDYSFTPNPTANDFKPSCGNPINRKLHELACGKSTLLDDQAAILLFRSKLESTRQLAIYYHTNSADGTRRCESISFRLRNSIFHYFPRLTRHLRSDVIQALNELVGNKRVFVYLAERAIGILDDEFCWTPENIIDAAEVARKEKIKASFAEIAKYTSGGDFCRRALNFSCSAIPSPVALLHIDVNSSVLYEFCVKILNLRGADMAASSEEEDRRSRATARDGNFKKPRRGSDNSRSRVR